MQFPLNFLKSIEDITGLIDEGVDASKKVASKSKEAVVEIGLEIALIVGLVSIVWLISKLMKHIRQFKAKEGDIQKHRNGIIYYGAGVLIVLVLIIISSIVLAKAMSFGH